MVINPLIKHDIQSYLIQYGRRFWSTTSPSVFPELSELRPDFVAARIVFAWQVVINTIRFVRQMEIRLVGIYSGNISSRGCLHISEKLTVCTVQQVRRDHWLFTKGYIVSAYRDHIAENFWKYSVSIILNHTLDNDTHLIKCWHSGPNRISRELYSNYYIKAKEG